MSTAEAGGEPNLIIRNGKIVTKHTVPQQYNQAPHLQWLNILPDGVVGDLVTTSQDEFSLGIINCCSVCNK